jgi:hypothetical protein
MVEDWKTTLMLVTNDLEIRIPGLVNIQKTIENCPIEIVSLPIKNGGSFHSYVTVYQRVPSCEKKPENGTYAN